MKNINLGAHFLFLLILCSIKIERLLFLKFLKILAFFDSYFWPFKKSEEKIKVIFAISEIMPSIWNVFFKFRWHDEKVTEDVASNPNDFNFARSLGEIVWQLSHYVQERWNFPHIIIVSCVIGKAATVIFRLDHKLGT